MNYRVSDGSSVVKITIQRFPHVAGAQGQYQSFSVYGADVEKITVGIKSYLAGVELESLRARIAELEADI